jgi:hypothetical protein
MYCLLTFKLAFDCVDRQKIIQILQELKIPNNLIRLIKNDNPEH